MDHALPFPVFTRGERIADTLVHALGISAGAVGVPTLVAVAAYYQGGLVAGVVLAYGAGLIVMLVASALYNLARPSRRKEVLRRIDHAAIFVMIAGTYTPFALGKIGGPWGAGLFAYVWLVAIGGVVMKLYFPRRLEGLSIVLYLALGWSVLPAIVPLTTALSTAAIVLIGVGGLLYSLGVMFHVWRRLPYHNAIWHLLVLGAASCHYAAVLVDVALGAA